MRTIRSLCIEGGFRTRPYIPMPIWSDSFPVNCYAETGQVICSGYPLLFASRNAKIGFLNFFVITELGCGIADCYLSCLQDIASMGDGKSH